jgi:hypothetical protein
MEFKQNKHPNKDSRVWILAKKGSNHVTSSFLAMVDYELYSECSMQNFAKVLHLHERWEIRGWLYQILQNRYMHDNTKKMDVMFFI